MKSGVYLARLLVVLSLSTACGQQPQASDLQIIDESLVQIDLLVKGPYRYNGYEYATAASVDAEIAPLIDSRTPTKTDIRGRLWLPQTSGPRPLLVFLHGNHFSCGQPPDSARDPRLDDSYEFARSGVCPPGKIEAPSYRGYDAQAELLASHGYAVISINANRGINALDGKDSDGFLVYARGLLVLKHLEALQQWSKLPQVPSIAASAVDLRGRLDWSEVGFMGHSRGGEGVRYAYNILTQGQSQQSWQQRLPGVKVGGIFEVGPIVRGAQVDSRIEQVEARGTAWTVLIPGCDQDVVDYEGVLPYRRMLSLNDGFAKSIFTVWGANHNFFNSQWQESDAPHRCRGQQQPLWQTTGQPFGEGYALLGLKGSPAQQTYLQALMLGFFKAHVGKERWLKGEHIFDPQYRLPAQLQNLAPSSREFFRAGEGVTVFDGSSAPLADRSGISRLQDFLQIQLQSLANWKQANDSRKFKRVEARLLPPMNFNRPAWALSSAAASNPTILTVAFNAPQSTATFWTLDLALAKYDACLTLPEQACAARPLDDVQVALVMADGSRTGAVSLRDYATFDAEHGAYFELSSENVGYTAGGRTLMLRFASVPPLYQTVRIELKDFGMIAGGLQITGLAFRFPAATEEALVLQSMRLSRRPGASSL